MVDDRSVQNMNPATGEGDPWDGVPDPGPQPPEPASWDAGAQAKLSEWRKATRRYLLAKCLREMARRASVEGSDSYHFTHLADQAVFTMGCMILAGDVSEKYAMTKGDVCEEE